MSRYQLYRVAVWAIILYDAITVFFLKVNKREVFHRAYNKENDVIL